MTGNWAAAPQPTTHKQPKQAKAEAEAYLREVEAEGRDEEVYGAGTTLLAPSPTFAVQTRAVGAAGADTETFVVNVCTSAKVAPMVQQQEQQDGAGGFGRVRVDIPICLGREQRRDDDGSVGGGAKVVRVWDAVVHPSTAERAAGSDAVREALVDSVSSVWCFLVSG